MWDKYPFFLVNNNTYQNTHEKSNINAKSVIKIINLLNNW